MENSIIATHFETEVVVKTRKKYKARVYNSGLPSVNINLTKAVMVGFVPGHRVAITIQDGELRFKSSPRDDANIVTATVNIKPDGAGRFRLNQHAIVRLIKQYGYEVVKNALTIGKSVAVSKGKYHWFEATGTTDVKSRFTIASMK